MASEIKVDTVSEKTSGSGVTIDGLLIKDGGISGDVSLIGTTPTFTIGDAGAEDAALVFDGNAQDFYIALDDSADDLLIGLGSTVGTTPAVSIDENLQVKIVATTASTSATTGSFIAAGGAGVAADLHVGDDVTLISDSAVLGFGADKDTTLTHTDGTGLTLNSTNKLCFGDAASFIQQSSDGVLRIDGEATVDINASSAVTIAADGIPVTIGGIPFFADAGNNSIYTHNVSGTDDTAANNTAYGLAAMDAITTGDRNTALGQSAAGALNTGANNTLLGRGAGEAQTTGDNSVAVGYRALATNVGGHNNVAVGFEAGALNTASANTFVGHLAGTINAAGARNIAIGYQAYDNADAENDNLAIGHDALGGAVNGAEGCVMIGAYAGDAVTSGDKNVGVGHGSMTAVQAGENNTAVGADSGGGCTGSGNVYIGHASGNNAGSGGGQICIGNGTDPASGSQDYGIAIGYSISAATNDFSFGRASNVVTNDYDADADWSRSSDIRLKRNIESTTLGLDFINDLRPVKFQWKPSYEIPKEMTTEYHKKNQKNLDYVSHGFIAQEVKEAIDKHGDTTFGGWHMDKVDNETQRVKKNMFVMPLIKAVQELSAEVKELKAKLEAK